MPKRALPRPLVQKNASEGGSKAKAAPRKTKKQKEEEAADTEVAEREGNEDDDAKESNEDGMSLNLVASVNRPSNSPLIEPLVEGVALPSSAEVQLAEHLGKEDNSEVAGAVEVVSIPVPMNDEYEAYIRGLSMEAWLEWKEEVGYTFDLLNV